MAQPVCQLCSKRPSTVRLMEVDAAGALASELHACVHCLDRLDADLLRAPPPIAELLARNQAPAAQAPAKAHRDPACPECGLLFSQYQASNLLGCPACYPGFGVRLEALIRRHHGSLRHVGRGPGPRPDGEDLAARVARLERDLAQAVAAERFEDAARLRDDLRVLVQGEAAP